MRLGDLEIEGGLAAAQPKLVKAAAALAGIHELFDELERLRYPGRSKDSCILSACTARDFLRRIGYRDAVCLPVLAMVRAFRGDNEVWSVGVGDHTAMAKHIPGWSVQPRVDTARHGPTGMGWNGHLVAVVPSAKVFVDLTLYQLAKPYWPSLPGMVMAATDDQATTYEMWPGMLSLAAMSGIEDDGTKVIMAWARQPWNNSWKQAPDAHKAKNRAGVAALHGRVGKWRGCSSTA